MKQALTFPSSCQLAPGLPPALPPPEGPQAPVSWPSAGGEGATGKEAGGTPLPGAGSRKPGSITVRPGEAGTPHQPGLWRERPPTPRGAGSQVKERERGR